jgi:antitoxin component YwqK of YwqJK toxin-antitoxin module
MQFSIKNVMYLLTCIVFMGNIKANANDTLNVTDSNGKKQGWWEYINDKNQKPDCDENSKIEEGRYKDNSRNQGWKNYFCNGKLKSYITYEMDKKIGFATIYYANGKVMEEGEWKINKWVGKYKFYHENGQLYYDFNYNENGLREGVQKYYHANGKIMAEGNWHDSKEEGVIKEYNKNGQLVSEKTFDKGKADFASFKTFTPKEEAEEVKKEPEIVEVQKAPEPVKPEEIGYLKDGFNKILNTNGTVNKEGEFLKGKLVNGKIYIYEGKTLTKTKIFKQGLLFSTIDAKTGKEEKTEK